SLLDDMIRPGLTVLIKPDLDCSRPPFDGQTTHPELVAVVGRMLRNRGAKVLVGDSPIVPHGCIESVWKQTGIADVARREKLKLVSFERDGTSPVAVDSRVYYIARPVIEADLIINLPRLRPNQWSYFTGAVWNMLGVMPGFQKGLHFKKSFGSDGIASVVVDVFSIAQPIFTIMDASGFGPLNGNGNRPSLLLASIDSVALDAVVADLAGLDPQMHSTTRLASEAGLGIGWMEAIKVVGPDIGPTGRKALRSQLESKMAWFSRLLIRSVSPLIEMKPQRNADQCSACHTCVKNCPTSALRLGSHGETVYIPQLCICCWRCVASCPSNAISIRQSPMAQQFLDQGRKSCAV
ncbi:MAG: DUF362 domain-containing protein, partial [candidate division Zixibacteria bacterium]|nr:DUF362 domain-containing protein [candidate division Zixibacteria bacterium]